MPITEAVIRAKAAAGEVDFTVHAVFEAAEDLLFVNDIEQALPSGEVIETDTQRTRCLVRGQAASGGLLHVVIDYADWLVDTHSNLVVVTVYCPDPNRWIDGRVRRG